MERKSHATAQRREERRSTVGFGVQEPNSMKTSFGREILGPCKREMGKTTKMGEMVPSKNCRSAVSYCAFARDLLRLVGSI
jgi:hypothetical protein